MKLMSKTIYERSIIELIMKPNDVYLPIFSVSLKLNELNKMTFGDSKILNANLMAFIFGFYHR